MNYAAAPEDDTFSQSGVDDFTSRCNRSCDCNGPWCIELWASSIAVVFAAFNACFHGCGDCCSGCGDGCGSCMGSCCQGNCCT